MSQRVIPIRSTALKPPKTKRLPANQATVDALAFDTGTWRIEGVPGLYLRSRARSKSFYIQRRVKGELAKRTIGAVSLKEARAEAMRVWSALKPPPAGGRKTFEQAFQEYLEQKDLADKTVSIYRYNAERHLASWKAAALQDIGEDPGSVRALYHRLRQKHGEATGAQVIRLLSAVYRYARRVDRSLPESPTLAVDLPQLPARDWALSPEALKAWWQAVKSLNPVKRAWWATTLLTGSRRASVEALQWPDLDFGKKTIQFRVTKRKPYTIPMADRLAGILAHYRDSGEVPPGRWVFPSPMKPDCHLSCVRDDKRGVVSAHHLRHSLRNQLVELGATPDQAKLLMGHALTGSVSERYITTGLVTESLRPMVNAVAERYAAILEGL